jgi:antitoxin HicB
LSGTVNERARVAIKVVPQNEGRYMDKTIEYYVGLPYAVRLVPETGGGWFVELPELPGCMSEGDDPTDAIAMISDAKRCWIQAAFEQGYPIPEPRELDQYSGKFVARVTRSLHRDLVDAAEREGVSLNQFVSTALARSVGEACVAVDPPPLTADASVKGLAIAFASAAGHEETTHAAGDSDSSEFIGRLDQLMDQGEIAVECGRWTDGLAAFAEAVSLARPHASDGPVQAALVHALCVGRAATGRALSSHVGASMEAVTQVEHVVRKRNLDTTLALDALVESLGMPMLAESAAGVLLDDGKMMWSQQRHG